jgi:GT2 family glycosyltransferase
MTTRGAVDVVVPVYNAADDVRRCVDAVLACTPALTRLVLIDDGSTDPGVAALFDALAARRDARVELLRNTRNEGFTFTANRGMRHSHADVVLLNSDTIVTTGWLEALVGCAASDPRIATVTPFSNNAEICSFPRFCEDNAWSDPEHIARALRERAVPTYPDLPTGVGFCMLVRRTAIDALGVFDLAFGAGYGEENDFCLRAAQAGWRNVLADDAFVVHAGGRSFEGRKADLGTKNLALIAARHPHYESMVRDYIAADPLHAIRAAAISRLALDRHERGVLHVVDEDDAEGEARARASIAASRDAYRHYLAIASAVRCRVEDHAVDDVVRFAFDVAAGEDWRAFVGALAATFRVSHVEDHRRGESAAPWASDPMASPAFPNRRIRDALGYRPWTPPTVRSADVASEAPSTAEVASEHAPVPPAPRRGVWARRARALRATPMGRLLHRVTPALLIEALKARLGG